jgi:hypothetical protein
MRDGRGVSWQRSGNAAPTSSASASAAKAFQKPGPLKLGAKPRTGRESSKGRIQVIVATPRYSADFSNWSRASAAVLQPSIFRGRPLRAAATAARSSGSWTLRSVPLGKYWRSRRLVFSVRAALPGAVRIAEIDLQTGVDPQLRVLCHFRTLVPGQRPLQLLRQGDDGARDGVADRFGPVPCERGAVLGAWPQAAPGHGRQVEQQGEPRGALHQGADGRAAQRPRIRSPSSGPAPPDPQLRADVR